MARDCFHMEKRMLRDIAAGDEGAFRTLFMQYRPRLYNYILGIVKSPQVAEELAMDVFLKLWIGRELLTQIDHFDQFLFRIAHNKTIDFLRSTARDNKLHQLLLHQLQYRSDHNADMLLIHHEYESKVRDAVGLLSPKRREVYRLSVDQDMAHDQIAVQLHISRSTVNNHIVEARRFIREYLVRKLEIAVATLIITLLYNI